jgi:hypothetical protein
MQKPVSIFASAACLAFGSAPAQAEHNWLSAGEFGAKPDRIHVLIDIGEIKAEEDGPFGAREAFISMPVMIIYESADKPDWSQFELRNYCDANNSSKVANILTYYRNDTSSKDMASIVFNPSKEFVGSLSSLVCGDSDKAFASGQFKPTPAEVAKDWNPTDYPWNKLWLDGKRPPYTTTDTRTRAEKDAEFDAKMAEAKAALGAAEATAISQIEKSKADEAFWKDQAIRRKNRPKSKLNAPLEAWLRRDEEYLVQALGMPDKAYNAGNTRILFYDSRGNWAQVFTTTDENGNVVSSSSQSYVCSLTLELQNNQLIDFKLAGNSCDYGEFAGR